jgi:HPt (histidine-containing phosphotransfer) domain-containing protein
VRPVYAGEPPVDLEALDTLTSGDVEFRRDIVTTFIGSAVAALADIEETLHSADVSALAGIAHRLKANGGYLSAARVAGTADELESAARTGRNADLRPIADRLKHEVTCAIEFLDANHSRPALNDHV